jgi:hypothetical protein
MHIAMSFERHRLRRSGTPDAEIFDPSRAEDQPSAYVFDVSTLSTIDQARNAHSQFAETLRALQEVGLSADTPGFDILTLDPRAAATAERLIELKSSGTNTKKQEMTWNEWKAAQESALRPYFYLYLVGQLRSDVPDCAPFIRAVHDPFASLIAEMLEHRATTKKVQLDVGSFATAEHLDLAIVKAGDSPSSVADRNRSKPGRVNERRKSAQR